MQPVTHFVKILGALAAHFYCAIRRGIRPSVCSSCRSLPGAPRIFEQLASACERKPRSPINRGQRIHPLGAPGVRGLHLQTPKKPVRGFRTVGVLSLMFSRPRRGGTPGFVFGDLEPGSLYPSPRTTNLPGGTPSSGFWSVGLPNLRGQRDAKLPVSEKPSSRAEDRSPSA